MAASASTRSGPLEEWKRLSRAIAYDEEWPARFESWRELIATVLKHAALRIDHVGSTSVLGLSAKPIVDVQVSAADMFDEEDYVPKLQRLGVQLRSRDDLHRYFRPFPDRPRGVHVHVCRSGSVWEREHLLCRDYVRATPAASEVYAEAKREASRVWSDDAWAYTDAKSELILDILKEAERWAMETTWRP